MQVKITNNSTKFSVYFDKVEVNMDNPLYTTVLVNTKDLTDGEYTIQIYTDRNSLIVEDLIRIGEHKTNTKVEYKIDKNFTQYVRK